MSKSFLLSVVAVFVVAMLLGFVVHGWILHAEYARLGPTLFRTEEQAQGYFGYMILAHILMAIGITWVYRQGRENKPWLMQGVRFGVALALVVTIPTYLIYYAVQPLPSDLVAQQIVFDTIAMVVLGIVTAGVNRDPVPARA